MNPTPSAEDRFLIADLCARYAWSLDTCDTDAFVGCFADDAVFDDMEIAQGREEIRALALRHFHQNPLFAGRQHLIGQTLFAPDERGRSDHWRMRSFAHVFTQRDIGPFLTWTGYYDDVVMKVRGEWLFRSRRGTKWTGDILERFPGHAIARAESVGRAEAAR